MNFIPIKKFVFYWLIIASRKNKVSTFHLFLLTYLLLFHNCSNLKKKTSVYYSFNNSTMCNYMYINKSTNFKIPC